MPVGDSTATVLGVTATHSLSSAGHISAWLRSRWSCPTTSSATPMGQQGERDKPRGGHPRRFQAVPRSCRVSRSLITSPSPRFPHSSRPSSLPGQEFFLSPCSSPLVTRPLLPPALTLSGPSQFSSCCHSNPPGCLPPPSHPTTSALGNMKCPCSPPSPPSDLGMLPRVPTIHLCHTQTLPGCPSQP